MGLNNRQHDFNRWGENQRIMLRDKTLCLTLSRPCWKMVPARLGKGEGRKAKAAAGGGWGTAKRYCGVRWQDPAALCFRRQQRGNGSPPGDLRSGSSDADVRRPGDAQPEVRSQPAWLRRLRRIPTR